MAIARKDIVESVARGMAAAYQRGVCSEIYDEDVDVEPFVEQYMHENWPVWVKSAEHFFDLVVMGEIAELSPPGICPGCGVVPTTEGQLVGAREGLCGECFFDAVQTARERQMHRSN